MVTPSQLSSFLNADNHIRSGENYSKMESETNVIEYEQTEAENDLKKQTKARTESVENQQEKGELRFLGTRGVITNPLSMCDKMDKMFGSGGEAIIHYMWFESGLELFGIMMKNSQNKSLEELLKALVDLQPNTGWGCVSLKIIRTDPPEVDIKVRNPPVKTVKGSRKHLIGSFWAGVLSRYFNRQLICKNFSYDADKDEFSCTVTV